jgi:hypothetical protein
MPVFKDNIIMEGLSGMLGDVVVFRQLRGKTVMSNRPSKPRSQSEQQRANRQRFKAAAQFAREAMQDPEKKERYRFKAQKLGLPNAYTAALTDYMRKPSVASVKCNGRANDRITIRASKKGFTLASVEVTLADAHGAPLTTQTAALKDRGTNEWIVRLPAAMWAARGGEPGKGCRVIVVAKDHTGNMTRSETEYARAA